MGRPKVRREIPDLLASLLRHVQLLRDYHDRAFVSRNEHYLGEVAAKIRLLVLETRTNKALLLGLMDHFQSQVGVRSEQPWGEVKFRSVREYMEEVCLVFPTPSDRAIITNAKLVGLWANQHGAAHEDWEHDEAYASMRRLGIFIGNDQAHILSLRGVARTVLSVADAFFQELENRGVLRRDA